MSVIQMNKFKKIINYFFTGFSYIANKKIMAILEIALLISLIQISTGYKEKIEEQEIKMYSEKIPTEAKIYTENTNIEDTSTGMSQLTSCYKETISKDNLPEELKKDIAELENLFQSDTNYFSYLYQDLYSGFTLSYNEDAPIFTASTIKAPAMIYLYEKASQNEINLEEKLTYTKNFYHGGSGVIQNQPVGSTYTIEKLIEYAIHDSDNIAYAMLMNRYKRENILNFWQAKGTKNIYTLDTIWGVTSAKDASIYMKELYRFKEENQTYGQKLLDYFKNAEWKLITDKNGNFNTANKGGWSDEAIHDVAIVFDRNPYLLIIMSNTGESDYNYLFNKTSILVGKIHESYWKYKENKCSNIPQH